MIKKANIPIARPYIGLSEYQSTIKSLINSTIGGASENHLICEKVISDTVQHKYSKLTSNGTVALQIAFEAVKAFLKKEYLTVIVPNVTFGATVNAALLTNNNVILADVDKITGLLCRESVNQIVEKFNIDCICLVSLNGRLVKSEDLVYYRSLGITLIEDQAEAFVSQYPNKSRSTHIFMSTLSFYANKIVTSGEGGAVCFSNDHLVEWTNTFINHGMINPGTYRHDIPGANYRMSSYNAGLLNAQLSRINKVKEHRRLVWDEFKSVKYQLVSKRFYEHGELPWLLEFQTRLPRQEFEDKMVNNRIQYRRYFTPMCAQPAFSGLTNTPLSNSYEFVSGRYFLPLFYGMTKKQVRRIIKAISE